MGDDLDLDLDTGGPGGVILLAGLAIVVGLPVLIKSIFEWLTARDKLKSRQPDGKHLVVK